MNNFNKCNVIRDLLPSYVDNLVSEDSITLIEDHLKNCNDCNHIKKKKKNSCNEEDKQYINYAKKIKKIISWLKTILLVLSLAIIILLALLFNMTNYNYKNLSQDTLNQSEELYKANRRIQELENQLNGY